MTDAVRLHQPPSRVRLNPPSPKLMRAVNPLVRRVLGSRLGRRIDLQALLEFEGRRSGRTLVVPACVHDLDGGPTVFTERPWRWNFDGGAAVKVTQAGRVRTGRGELLHLAPQDVGRALWDAMEAGAVPFELGLSVRGRERPTIDELSTIERSVIRIRFDED